jgi:hypothetical protein
MARTTTRAEYAIRKQREDGVWIPLSVQRYGSKIEAERDREQCIALAEAHPGSYFEEYVGSKVMKRQVTITTTEWEED